MDDGNVLEEMTREVCHATDGEFSIINNTLMLAKLRGYGLPGLEFTSCILHDVEGKSNYASSPDCACT